MKMVSLHCDIVIKDNDRDIWICIVICPLLLSGISLQVEFTVVNKMLCNCAMFIMSQVVTYNGFYDNNLEWVGLEGVQIVASMNAGTSLGRHKLTPRFTSVVRICCIG